MDLEKYLTLALMVQLLFPFVVLYRLSGQRIAAIKSGSLNPKFFKTYQTQGHNVSEKLLVGARHYENLFELPVIFFVICLIVLHFNLVDISLAIIAWIHVLARLAHSIVHLSSNKLLYRRRIFIFSYFILLAMWLVTLGKIFLA